MDYSRLRKILIPRLPKDRKSTEILCIGCGSSEMPRRLHEEGYTNVTGACAAFKTDDELLAISILASVELPFCCSFVFWQIGFSWPAAEGAVETATKAAILSAAETAILFRC